jgi:butyrate kinase
MYKEYTMKQCKVFTINPGSTSTKIALFNGCEAVYSKKVVHDADSLKSFKTLADQFEYRYQTIQRSLESDGMSLENLDAVVGRGGGLLSMEGGTYEIDDLLLEHSMRGANGVQHPANLGPKLAFTFAHRCMARSFVVNPPDVDELQDVARLTGIKGVYRTVHLHALSLKETAIRHAAGLGKRYEDCNFIGCHIGGGISICAHFHGRMIDGFDIVGGEGPMAPTRCGSISVSTLLDYCRGKDPEEVKQLCTKTGGLVSHIGISDALELTIRAKNGDKKADLLWQTMMYQINKCIGSMAAVLHGTVDGILVSGGMARDADLLAHINSACGWIAPVTAYADDLEMEAMAAGAVRVLQKKETVKKYKGVSCFTGFDFE